MQKSVACIYTVQVQSVWRVKTLTHQLKPTRKRRKLADGIELVQAEEPDQEARKALNDVVALSFAI